jgi:hypothetical protein
MFSPRKAERHSLGQFFRCPLAALLSKAHHLSFAPHWLRFYQKRATLLSHLIGMRFYQKRATLLPRFIGGRTEGPRSRDLTSKSDPT